MVSRCLWCKLSEQHLVTGPRGLETWYPIVTLVGICTEEMREDFFESKMLCFIYLFKTTS